MTQKNAAGDGQTGYLIARALDGSITQGNGAVGMMTIFN
jgi:hypothetical protein